VSSAPDFTVEHLSPETTAGAALLSGLLASSTDALSEHKALLLTSAQDQQHLGVVSQGQLLAAAILAPHGEVWNIELIARTNQEHARMVAFDAAMIHLNGAIVQLWEPLSGLSVELEEAISRYDVEETRTLLHLTRDLEQHPLSGNEVETYTFNFERDAERFITANNLAFAQHKEQGSWTEATLVERMAQSWFDDSLFFLAGQDAVTAWCWCKVDLAKGADRGEIYVIGTSPTAQGQGLGRSMLERGCAEMAARGIRFVDLYVDGDNTAALALYNRAHFDETSQRRSWLFS